MRRIRVLIVDDHLVFAQALQTALALEPDLEVVGVVSQGLAASREAVRTSPHVVLMDYGLPDVSGAVATEAIKELMPSVQVVLLTSYSETRVLLESLRAGVSGFLPKEKAVSDVVEAVRLAAAGEMRIPPATLRSLLARLDAEPAATSQRPLVSDGLTPREQEVLQCLADGATQETIAERLEISPNTVRTHVQRILQKLGVHSKLEAVSYAISRKLVRPPQ